MPDRGVRRTFLAAASVLLDVLERDDVVAAWDRPSALEGWTVGGLVGHTARAVLTARRYLGSAPPPPGTKPVDAPGYLLAVLGDDDLAPDSPLATQIRARGDQEAADGVDALRGRLGEALDALTGAFGPGGEPPERLIEVLDGVAITLDDYLATRVVELVVHLDDVAASLPEDPGLVLPPPALQLATDVLVAVARGRRGDLGLLRVLARQERAPEGPVAL